MKYFVLLLCFFITFNAFAQGENNKFGRTSAISFSKRLNKYPFNKAVKIEVVSFIDATAGGQRDTTKKVVFNQNMPHSYMAVCINPFKEKITLNKQQIERLTDIVFNFGALNNMHISESASCYAPKNAILFIDENGKVFDFIEICFTCLHMETYSKKLDVKSMCDHHINMIKKIFIQAGIKYGVINFL